MSQTNVKVNKREKDNPMSLLSKFKKRVQESGAIIKARQNRYSTRALSKSKIKKDKLKKLVKTAKYEDLKRLGKLIKKK